MRAVLRLLFGTYLCGAVSVQKGLAKPLRPVREQGERRQCVRVTGRSEVAGQSYSTGRHVGPADARVSVPLTKRRMNLCDHPPNNLRRMKTRSFDQLGLQRLWVKRTNKESIRLHQGSEDRSLIQGTLSGVARAGKPHRGQYGELTPLRQRGGGGTIPPPYPLALPTSFSIGVHRYPSVVNPRSVCLT